MCADMNPASREQEAECPMGASEHDEMAHVLRARGPKTDDALLSRVAVRARDKAGRPRTRRSPAPALRFAAAAIAAAAVIAVSVWALNPGFDDSAFAREAAVDALLPAEGVFHTRAAYEGEYDTQTGGPQPRHQEIWEDWVDAEAGEQRGEIFTSADGELVMRMVRTGGVTRTWAGGQAIDKETNTYHSSDDEQQLLEGPTTDPVMSGAGSIVAQLREGIDSGKAQVVDRVLEDGDEYWVVEWEIEGDEVASSVVVRAKLRSSDYRLRSVEIVREGRNIGDGKFRMVDRWEWLVWEVIERDALPDGFFALERASELAKPGTPLERQ